MMQIAPNTTIDPQSVHAVQDNGQTLTLFVAGQQMQVAAPFADSVRVMLGLGLNVRGFQQDRPNSHMARFNNPNINDPLPDMPGSAAPPLHVPGQPMSDDVKKRLGLL